MTVGGGVAQATEAVELCRRFGDAVGLGLALHRLAVMPRRDVGAQEALLLEALALFEAANFAWGIGTALSALAIWLWRSGDLARAEELLARALAVHQSLGDDLGAAAVLSYLGAVVDDARRHPVRAPSTRRASRPRGHTACTRAAGVLWARCGWLTWRHPRAAATRRERC